MRERKLLLVLSQSLIGTGFFFLYMQHVRSIFETKVSHLTQLEREALFRREDALYYTFYKTLTEAPDFWSGYDKLKNVTGIEYPRSVNVLRRFHLLPELTIGYMYHLARHYGGDNAFLFFSCWRTNDVRLPIEHQRCDTFAQPMQFYLEFVWLLGGMTILIIYMYGTLLSENIFGGIYAVVSYIMFHSYAAKIYERPVARENFAFPIIFLQMFYLSMAIDRIYMRKEYTSRFLITFKLTVLTTLAMVCWQFASVIFTAQLFILLTPWGVNFLPSATFNAFAMDYAMSQFLANALAFFLSLGNQTYLYTWQFGPAFGLFFVYLVRSMSSTAHSKEISMKAMTLAILIATSAQGTLLGLLEKMGLVHPANDTFILYWDLLLHWLLQAKVNFVTSLAACNGAYSRMEWSDLWELIKTLIVKPYCMYGVVMLAKFFRKWRKSSEPKTQNLDYIERSKKYVLEDFLEENHVSMRDMSNIQTEQELNECLKLLEQCDFDYERYKTEKSKLKADKPDEHAEFMNHIKKLKEQINELNETKRNQERDSREQRDAKEADAAPAADTAAAEDQNQEKEEEETSEKTTAVDAGEATPQPSQSETLNNTNNSSSSSSSRRSRNVKATAKQSANNNASASPAANNRCGGSTAAAASPRKAAGQKASAGGTMPEGTWVNLHYFYNMVQMILFTAIGLCVKKLFFLCFTLGCVIAPTLCSKFWYRKQRHIFWTISLAVFLTSIFDPGLVNIREEYFPTKYSKYATDDLDSMLEWIKINTEKDAVFAGPVDIIGTVHLTTRRPIVNHAHLEMRQISERTEHVYSVFSRQQSSDIYNQCSQLKIQYLIVTLNDCSNDIKDDCDYLAIWDDMQPAYRKYPQFCFDLVSKNVPSFLKVFANDNYGIIKMFSQSVQINLRYNKMPEKAI